MKQLFGHSIFFSNCQPKKQKKKLVKFLQNHQPHPRAHLHLAVAVDLGHFRSDLESHFTQNNNIVIITNDPKI